LLCLHPAFSYLFFYCYVAHRDLPSFPTRRSSDLPTNGSSRTSRSATVSLAVTECPVGTMSTRRSVPRRRVSSDPVSVVSAAIPRSEEHTSELQSLTNLVCRLLLEKKNTGITPLYS